MSRLGKPGSHTHPPGILHHPTIVINHPHVVQRDRNLGTQLCSSRSRRQLRQRVKAGWRVRACRLGAWAGVF
jgi:hypothetical protein